MPYLNKMLLRLGFVLWLGVIATAGPVAWDDSKCSQRCNGGTKFQYSEASSYIYSFESQNKMAADGTSDLNMLMKATIKITAVSKCEMVLQITDVESQHGTIKETSSVFIEELKRNPLPFAWDDGKIDHICPSPDDSNEINNIKRAILSSFQNSMKSFDASRYDKEVDVLGSCDTQYSIDKIENEKYIFKKHKNIETCTRHLKGQTILLASFYESASTRQHLPFLSGESLHCTQTVDNGIMEEVTCEETASFKPLLDYGYVVDARGKTTLKKISSEPASRILYRAPYKESLVFKYTPKVKKDESLVSEAQAILRSICDSSATLLSKDAANKIHQLVYVIRRLSLESLESIYDSVKSKQLCGSGKALTIFQDALKASASGGSISLLSKLAARGEISKLDSIIWLSLLPFTSYVEEESVAATLPLLKKDSASKYALLGVSAMAYKYCFTYGGCETSKAVGDVSASLKQILGDKCQASNEDEEIQIITALKAFGNLGYVGESADSIFECATLATNKIPIRIAAIEAFRRSPCTENVVSKLLDIYKSKTEDDEVRIASLISLSRCPTVEIVRQVLELYALETSNQVKVFTWSYLVNLQESSDPVNQKIQNILYAEDFERPSSTDITKFSRNFQVSLFSQLLNIGETLEANVIHSRNSFLPRSANLGWKVDVFGNQLDLLEVGGRVEDLEYILEKLFGPHGLMPNLKIDDILSLVPPNLLSRFKRSADSYKSKIEALSERLGYSRGKLPHGNGYIRVLGHEMNWIHLDKDTLSRYKNKGINLNSIKELLQTLASTNNVDLTKNLLYLDLSVLFPSVTGRAYKLAGNLSSTIGLKGDGKVDLTQPDLPFPRADIQGSFQPSLLIDSSASFTIHSENFEPGVKVETVVNAGVDLDTKFEMKHGRLLHLKVKRRQNKQEIASIKRTLYCMNEKGVTELPKPQSYNLNYCTKYLQYFTGAKYCASMTLPHIYNAQGKPKIPFVRAMEASLVVEETDPNMNGYEFLLELPEWGKWDDRKYKLLLDTPNSSIDRKFSLDVHGKIHAPGKYSESLKLHTPLYTSEIDVEAVDHDDSFKLQIKALGNGKRKYDLTLDVGKTVKGAKLVEYSPQMKLSLPNVRPVEITGTIVYARGRKEQITINLQSNSFSSPLTIKGNIARDGEKIGLDSDWRLHNDFNITAFSMIHKVYGTLGNRVGKGGYLNLGHHYEPDGRSYESVTINAALEDIRLRDRLSFKLSSAVLLAEHQDLNTMLKWDFSFKPLEHIKNDIIFRYGENFEDDTHLVQVSQSLAFGGDFDTFQRMDIENKLGLTISCLDFSKSGALSIVWDFIDKPKVMVEVGLKTNMENQVYFKYDYSHVSDAPLKLASEATFIYYKSKLLYRNQLQEVGTNEYQGKAVLEPAENKQISIDYTYKVKSQQHFHHEIEASINFPGKPVPVQQKTILMNSPTEFLFSSSTDYGSGSPYTLDIKWQRGVKGELSINTAYLEGQFVVENQNSIRSIKAEFNMKKVYNKKISIMGSVTPGDPNILNVEVEWESDGSQKKVVLNAKSTKGTEDGVEKYIITSTVNYVGAISVDITGKVSTDFLRGPHYFRADYTAKEPIAVEFTHEIKNGKLESFGRYLNNNAERLRMDIKGKMEFTGYKFELDGGLFMTSPYKSLDGKEIYFRIMADSTDTLRTFISEYRIRPVSFINYAGKLEYTRKRGWPGQIKGIALVTVHNRPSIEGTTAIDYGNGKYSLKSSLTPLSRRKINLMSTFEHSGRFAAFHHSLSTSFEYLQTVDLKAVADLRNMEDAKIHSNFDINKHKLYDVNSTLKFRTLIDFDGHLTIYSKITPSLKLFYKTQASGQLTKYEMNLDVDSNSLMTGSGEIKKRKKGFNGDLIFKYREKEFLALTITQEAKSQRERNYLIKSKTPWRNHVATIKVVKDKKGSSKYETKFCREKQDDKCISIDVAHKEIADGNEWNICYKRQEVDFCIERIRTDTKEVSRYHTVIYKGDIRYGYDVRFGREGNGLMTSTGLILPSREIVNKIVAEVSLSKPKLKWELSLDAAKNPDRKLVTDLRFENHLTDSQASKLDITIKHPIYERPIEIKIVGDLELAQNKIYTGEMSLEYSNDPEDKLIGKLSVEKGPVPNAILNIYHKDEQHLDFVVKLNGTMNENEDYLGLIWNWKDDSNTEQEAFMIYNWLEKDKKFYFAYKRPKLNYRLDAEVVASQTLLEEKQVTDLTSNLNGEITKYKIINDYARGCDQLHVLNDDGEKKRSYELCLNEDSRKILSILVEGLDDENQWTFQYSLEIIRKNWWTIGIINNFNPEFLGQTLFRLSALGDELTAAGVGTLPISDTTRYKQIKSSFTSKIVQPSLRFFVPEATKFISGLFRDITTLKQKLTFYYHTLPSFEEVRHFGKKVMSIAQAVTHEIWNIVGSYYKNSLETTLQTVHKFVELIKKTCDGYPECKAFVKAYHDDGLKGLVKQLKDYLLRLPDRIQHFLSQEHTELRNFLSKVLTLLKGALEPLTKYRCGEIVVKVVRLSYQKLEPIAQRFLREFPSYYRSVREKIVTNPYVIQGAKLAKETYYNVREALMKIDYKKLYKLGVEKLEEYLLNMNPPSLKKSFKVLALNTEKGIAEFEIYVASSHPLPRKIIDYTVSTTKSILARLSDIQPSWKSILVKFKRGVDLNFFPPYEAQAMILGNQHYVTFDKEFFDFAGECTYLLTRDFEDGNFTFALTPKEGDKNPSILAWINDASIELNPADKSVLVGDKAVELPYLSKEFVVSRSGHAITINDRHGVQVKCNLVHELCSFSISGFYYGKTAGLLGTYNYEPKDDFKRPKGQIANSATVHAKSWELKKGCKSNNLVAEPRINERSDYYKICKEHFVDDASPLSACFSEVSPADYMQLCLRHLAAASDTTKALCRVSAAYVTECERNYVELSLPNKCLVCTAPDGSTLQHSDKKKYENLSKKSSDVVFIIEDHECNKAIVGELGNIARSIDRELQTEGYKDNMFGVVGYGGDVGSAEIFTISGNTFFSSRDINAIAGRLSMQSNKVESSRAFEAMKLAVTYLSRSDTSKSFVLFSCSSCKYDFKSLQYPVVQQILLERGISLHVVHSAEIAIRKSKEKDIIGVDPDTVYHSKDVTQRELVGEPALRSQVTIPKDLCIALSQDVNGSFFSTYPLSKGTSDAKNWRSVFSRKFIKAVQSFQCQWCDCTSTRDHIPNTVCQPCETKRPRLPYSVCTSCALPRTVEVFLSYIRHFI